MKSHRTAMALAVAAAASAFSAPQVYAQGDLALEEVVVTARKRTENLQDVPIAVTAFDSVTLQRAGVERADDYISLVPNVTIVDTANVGDTQVSIRGIISTRDAESTFAYVVDGVLSTNPNSFNEELFDVEQIEVLKGPQGALYGRNAVAGAILVNTKKPTDEFEARIGGGIGNNDTYKLNAMVSGPIIGDTLMGRIAYAGRETNGHYENIFTNEDDVVDFMQDDSFRARLIWNASDTLSFDFRAGYSEVEAGAINFNAAFALPAFVEGTGSPSFLQDVNDLDFRFTFNTPGENEQETLDFAIKMDWELSFADVVASFAYNDLEEYLLSDGTSATFYGYELTPQCQTDRQTLNSFTRTDLFGDPVDPFLVLPPPPVGADFEGIYGPYTPTSCDGYQYQERNQEDVSIDVRFVSPAEQPLRWIAGVYFAEIEREVVVAYGADQGQGFLRTPYVPADGPNPTDLLFWDDFDTTVYSAYGQLEFDLTDSLELAFALRYDREEREVSNKVPNVDNSGLNINLIDPETGQPGPINPAYNTNPNGIPDRDETYDQWQPKLTLNWALSDNINLYGSYGIGFRSGGFNSIGTEDLLNFWFNAGFGGPGEFVDAQLQVRDDYDKEVSQNFEIGLKSTLFDNRLRLNMAIFRNDVEDNQSFEFYAGPFGILRTVTTIDEMYIQGFEADFNWLVTEGLSIYGGIGLLDSEIEKNNHRPLSEGNEVPQAPETTGNLGLQWVAPVGERYSFVTRLDWQYVGETWFHPLQGEGTSTIWDAFNGVSNVFFNDFSKSSRDAYDTLNLRVGLESDRWVVTAWGKNLTDEEYLQEVIPTPEFGGSFNHPSALRSYGLDVVFNF